jgi:hypothetical protein
VEVGVGGQKRVDVEVKFGLHCRYDICMTSLAAVITLSIEEK